MLVQKINLATNKRQVGEIELDDISTTAKDTLGGSELDAPYRTLYVSEDFTTGGAFYDTLAGAITFANTLAYNVLLKIYPGTYTGNYSLDPNVILEFMPETFLVATDKTISVLILAAGARVYGKVRIEYAITSGYAVTMAKNCIFEALTCAADTDAIVINDVSGSAIDSQIRVKELGKVNVIGLQGNLYIDSDKFSQLAYAGANDCYVNCKLFKKDLTVSTGKVFLNTERYFKESDTIFDISGGTTIANGRVDNYDDTTNSTTGEGHIAKVAAGTLKLHDFYAKNSSGGVIWGAGAGTLIIGSSVLQSTNIGGGSSTYPIAGLGGFTVKYVGNTGINLATQNPPIVELITANKRQDVNITI